MRVVRTVAVVAVVVALGATAAVAARDTPSSDPRIWDSAAERDMRDADIAWYLTRAAADPTGGYDQLKLGALYLQRSRERGAPGDLILAETAARTSLHNRRAHNAEAFRVLALALVGQHRFQEAAAAADSLLASDPTAPGARSLRAEIDLELGRYAEADRAFAALDRRDADPAVLARVARWAAVRGRPGHARMLLEQARDAARNRAGTPAEQIAWFDLRLGELALSVGAHREARRALRDAAVIIPDDPRILLAQARLALARRDPASALGFAEQAMNTGEDPMAFALASEALQQLGRQAESDRMFLAFETSIAAVEGLAWHRQWRLALLDRGRQRVEVLSQAGADLQTRQDVYGWDLYAWALYHNGRVEDARRAMREALKWGTEDLLLESHARALGVVR